MGVEAAMDAFEADLGPNWTTVYKGSGKGAYRPMALPTFRPLRPDEFVMIDMYCKCGETVGRVGFPARTGAGFIAVEYRCPACGNNGWWRSSPRHI